MKPMMTKFRYGYSKISSQASINRDERPGFSLGAYGNNIKSS